VINIRPWEIKTVNRRLTVGLPKNAFTLAAENSLVHAFINLISLYGAEKITVHMKKEESQIAEDKELLLLSFDLIRTFKQQYYSVRGEKEVQKK
jgi:hypothetical protein